MCGSGEEGERKRESLRSVDELGFGVTEQNNAIFVKLCWYIHEPFGHGFFSILFTVISFSSSTSVTIKIVPGCSNL